MILDVDFLIDFFKKHTNGDVKGEMGEQDAAAAPAAPSGGSGGSVPKWADSYPIKRDKANKPINNIIYFIVRMAESA